ncbi:pre-mRNA-splicing factor 38B isoform X1 [Entelurus aequoreus]|uniref:pre-mRNA-splicing factor 38B isoform X1 n=1 Tax=Entelurus aequoreus TaxID=161455 RepID=UPI002B1E088D|nr:pre-mRNA-splicing factor 38B isoform X1 [Entelurus aequoreus]
MVNHHLCAKRYIFILIAIYLVESNYCGWSARQLKMKTVTFHNRNKYNDCKSSTKSKARVNCTRRSLSIHPSIFYRLSLSSKLFIAALLDLIRYVQVYLMIRPMNVFDSRCATRPPIVVLHSIEMNKSYLYIFIILPNWLIPLFFSLDAHCAAGELDSVSQHCWFVCELDVKAGGGCVMTVGEMLRSFLTKLEWFSTLFPRIPVPVQKNIDQQMKARPRKVVQKEPVEEEEDFGEAGRQGERRRSRTPRRTPSPRRSPKRSRSRSHHRERERHGPSFDRELERERERQRKERDGRDRDRGDRERRRSRSAERNHQERRERRRSCSSSRDRRRELRDKERDAGDDRSKRKERDHHRDRPAEKEKSKERKSKGESDDRRHKDDRERHREERKAKKSSRSGSREKRHKSGGEEKSRKQDGSHSREKERDGEQRPHKRSHSKERSHHQRESSNNKHAVRRKSASIE